MSTPSASEESLAFRLSDIQLDEIMRLCQSLAPHCRDACCASSPMNYVVAAMSATAPAMAFAAIPRVRARKSENDFLALLGDSHR